VPIGEINTIITVGESPNRGIPNITLENARFYGRPNFSGEEDRFKDTRRKFTVLIPNDVADQLREIGYNVKTDIPTQQEVEEYGKETISHLKVMLNLYNDPDDSRNPPIIVRQGESQEKLSVKTVGMLDRSRLESMDMEIRGWEYDPEDQPGQFSARLVALVATLRPNRLEEKWGMLR
jgi:hypothetical protein